MIKKICLLSVLLLAVFACKKDEKKEPVGTVTPPAAQYDKFSMKLDGTAFSFPDAFIQNNGGLIIMSAAVGNSVFTVVINDTVNAGTSTIEEYGAFRLTHTDNGFSTTYRSTAGSVTVVSHDKENDVIKGYYNCTLTENTSTSTKTVTEGEFNIAY